MSARPVALARGGDLADMSAVHLTVADPLPGAALAVVAPGPVSTFATLPGMFSMNQTDPSAATVIWNGVQLALAIGYAAEKVPDVVRL